MNKIKNLWMAKDSQEGLTFMVDHWYTNGTQNDNPYEIGKHGAGFISDAPP